MIFREIELDLPYISNDKYINYLIFSKEYNYKQAKIKDYNENWKAKRKQFSVNTRCITSMVERLMGKVVTKNCKKIVIECIPVDFKERINEPRNFQGIYFIQLELNCGKFYLLDNTNKKAVILDLILNALKIISKNESLDLSKFEDVYKQIVESKYENKWIWKSVVSPNKTMIASLILDHDIDFITGYLQVTDKNENIIIFNKIFRDSPDEYTYSKYLGDFFWSDTNKVTLININKENYDITIQSN